MTTSEEFLNSVLAVLKERENNYDNPSENFKRIADYWSVLLRDLVMPVITRVIKLLQEGDTELALWYLARYEFEIPIDYVPLVMILMKVAREQYKPNDDNDLDIVGYVVNHVRIKGGK